MTAPRVVYVADFTIDPSVVQTASDLPTRVMANRPILSRLRNNFGGVTGPSDSTDPSQEARQAVDQLATALVRELTRSGVSAQRVRAGAEPPADGWIVHGIFVALDEGNRVTSSMVGFGTGQPHVEVSGDIVALTNNSSSLVLTFGDSSQNRHMPGAAITRNPYAMAARFVMSRGATGRDVQDLGKRLGEEIVTFMRDRNLLSR
ncbi:MAG: DUF4410 domain-containing protein [Alphaproteobacteria bacterium]|nr:DUF4410 domain-containing protein [Alphaproteobacteria bacterium]